jgi:hypothetical protein
MTVDARLRLVCGRVSAVSRHLAALAPGTKTRNSASTYRKTQRGSMSAGSLVKLSPSQCGSLAPRSEQVVAALSTGIEKLSSEDAKKQLYVVLAMLYSILRHTYSPDAMWLAMRSARKMCPQLTDEEFESIKAGVMGMWDFATAGDPIRSLF